MPRISPSLTAGGNLDVAVSTRASAVDMATVLARLPAGGAATAVQYGTIALSNLVTAQAVISSVNLATSVVHFLGFLSTGTNAAALDADYPDLTLTDATHVTATRNNGPVDGMIVNFAVVTYSGVKTIQTATIAIASAANATGTISAVTAAKTVLVYQGFTTSGAGGIDLQRNPTITLTNGTTVTASRTIVTAVVTTARFTVLEFA